MSGWWKGLSRREQLLLALMVALAVPVLLWLGVARPLAAARAGAEARLATAQRALAAVEIAGPALTRLAGRGDAMARVRQGLEGAGLAAETLEAEGNGQIRVRIAAVRGPVLLRLLAGLEADGLMVETLAVSRNEDMSVTASFAVRGAAG
jgi:general secretion pathway protein M